MGLERIIEALVSLGLTELDAEVYIYISKKGPHDFIELDSELNYSRNQISNSLRTLLNKFLITKNGNKYSAIPFEEAFDLLLKNQVERVELLGKIEE